MEEGGFLFTRLGFEACGPGFPGTLRYNGRATGDEVVRVEIDAKEDPFLKSLIGRGMIHSGGLRVRVIRLKF